MISRHTPDRGGLEVSEHLHKNHDLNTACVSYVDKEIHVKFIGVRDALSQEKKKKKVVKK